MNEVIILYDRKIKTEASCENVINSLKQLNVSNVKYLSSEEIQNSDFKNTKLLINTLGKYYREDKWDIILNFYNSGGVILNIGCKPFSIPFTRVSNETVIMPETVSAIRTLSVVDYWANTPPVDKKMGFKVLNSRYNFLSEMHKNYELPEMIETNSIHYSLSGTENIDSNEEKWITDAQFETACGYYDSAGRLLSVPISRIDHFEKGSLIFLNFTPKEKDYYSKKSGQKLLANIIRTALQDTVKVEFFSEYALYRDSETPKLCTNIFSLGINQKSSGHYKIKILLSNGKTNSLLYFENIELQENIFSKELKIENLQKGFYKAKVKVYKNDQLLAEKKTGFYKYSNKNIQTILSNVTPLYLDLSQSTDFCMQNGKPFPMHGTTYFVTDNYQECFVNFNTFQCDADLRELKSAGFNILRSGIWKLFLTFYDNEGNIKEKSLRALEAYFLTAAKYGFPVQFVMGSTIFNNWDFSKCPIHNPEMKSKVVNAFRCFAERFKSWPNVSIDIINEPSYSRAGTWTLGRPSGDKYEKINWIKWLKKKYQDDISKLRYAWGVNSDKVKTFESAYLPKPHQFSRIYYRTEHYIEFAFLTDFFAFARESFSGWVAEIFNIVKSYAPKMIVIMGRDESIRIPSLQDEAYNGNIEFINWHQWSKNSIVFIEYFLNKVRNLPCCGQELGVYQYETPRGMKRFSDIGYSYILERKLLYSLGNWIQWQSFNNPYKKELSENSLGLCRADRTETAGMEITRLLTRIENKMSQFMLARNENTTEILTLHPTNYYFSVDNIIASQGVRNHVIALHYHLKMQSDMVMEHLFNKENISQTGNPKLIILPAAQLLSNDAWNLLVDYIKDGLTVLISGNINTDVYWRKSDRLGKLGINTRTIPINSGEKIRIKNRYYSVSFRKATDYCDPSHAIDKTVYANEKYNTVKVFAIGKGKLIHCPIPMELTDSIEPLCKLYQFAINESGITNKICKIKNNTLKPNLLFYPVSYKACTVYTLVNEGNDDFIEFTDLSSNAKVKIFVNAQRACKIWISKNGQLLGAYIHNKLLVNEKSIESFGDLSIYKTKSGLAFMSGKRKKPYIKVYSEKINIDKSDLFKTLMVSD